MRIRALFTLLTAALMFSFAIADDEKVPVEKLPEAVKKAVKEKFPNATIIEATSEEEKGVVGYEVELKDGAAKMSVSLTAEGKIIEVEKTIVLKDLPKAVLDAVEAKFPKSKLISAEEIVKDKQTSYEIQGKSADEKDFELEVDSKGKIVPDDDDKQEEKQDDKQQG